MFVIKFQFEDDIRRITVDKFMPIQEILELVHSLFKENLPQHFVLKYKDDEGDFVSVTNDREMEEALRIFKDSGILRFYVTKIEAPKAIPSIPTPIPEKKSKNKLEEIVDSVTPYVEAVENEIREAWPKIEKQCNTLYPKIEEQLKSLGETALETIAQVFAENSKIEVVHPALCDNCQDRIKGLRWKCLNCPDYDLCNNCKEKDVHKEHPFIKLEKPFFTGNRGPCQKTYVPPTEEEEPNVAQVPLNIVKDVPSQPSSTAPLATEPKEEEPKKAEEPEKLEDPRELEFQGKLRQLEEMGFFDRSRNVQFLTKYCGDMVLVVRDLLE